MSNSKPLYERADETKIIKDKGLCLVVTATLRESNAIWTGVINNEQHTRITGEVKSEEDFRRVAQMVMELLELEASTR